ncbi:MAG: hypothetical protein IT423_09415 [Pirellulaceae bacterium]|nr:hypothetical protein [Pirellulaceae bacterium]
MAERPLVRRKLRTSVKPEASSPRRPHYLDRPAQQVESRSTSSSSSVKLHTDDWMHVELPRGDYVLAALVAISVALIVGSFTLLPAIVFFNWLALAAGSIWAKMIAGIPVFCGVSGAWFCLRRAKSDRIRQRLLQELRD